MSDTESPVDPQLVDESNQYDLSDVSENEVNDLKDDEPANEEYNNDDDDNDILDSDDLSKLKIKKRSKAPAVNDDEEERPVKRRAFSSDADEQQQQSDHNNAEVHFSEESHDSAAKRREALEAKLERALKKPKARKRKDEHDLTNDDDELIQILKQQMDTAAKKDAELIENQSGIAINKIQLLPKVRDILSKVNLAEVILDNNLLAEIRQWLEPLPDASLPSYEIQKTLFSALLKLPINTNHLRESGIGKILLFYQKSKRVEPKIKRVADKLISDWTRPIIGASDNYRDKQVHSIDFDSAALRARLGRASLSSEPRKKEVRSIYEEQAAKRNRAAAPAPAVSDYKFAPKSRTDRTALTIASAGVGSSLNRDDQFKRINSKLTGRRTVTKKSKVNIEGRGSGL